MLSQVYVAFKILYQHIVHVDRDAVYNIIFSFAMFIFKRSCLLSLNRSSSCNICCNSCGVPVHKNM